MMMTIDLGEEYTSPDEVVDTETEGSESTEENTGSETGSNTGTETDGEVTDEVTKPDNGENPDGENPDGEEPSGDGETGGDAGTDIPGDEPTDDTTGDDTTGDDTSNDSPEEEPTPDVTTYMSLYERVLANLPDEYKLLSKSDEEITWTLHFTLLPAITSFHICKQNLDDRDEENERFNIKLTTEEFIILTNYMTINYIDSNYIRVPTALELSLTSKDFNTFSPAKHLDTIKSIREMYVSENDSLCMKYSMRNKLKSLKENADANN